jgi:hypothetical protein
MANDKAWLDVLLVVHEDEFFARSKSGTIWGTVYFQIGENEFFPGKGWTDLVAAFVGAWVQGLVRVAHGSSQQERVPFFDGPFAVDISMRQKGFVDLSFVRVEKSTLSRTVDIKHLLAHGHSVGSELLSLCRQRQWNNRGTVTERSMTFCSSRMFPGQGYD